jgi:spermidine synthase
MQPLLPIVYSIFFLSGAAALMYEVLWVRSLSLIFGGTHLAVTTVLTVFMGGLALGGFLIGRRVDGIKSPLRFYGCLEMAIALCAVVFLLLVKIYPDVYIFLVQGREDSPFYLSIVRVLFATLSLIVPTTLMGATLPVLARFVSGHPARIGAHLSFLYGFNTLGAVAGTVVTGFLLLRFYSVETAYQTAILINCGVGLASILIPTRLTMAISDRHNKIPEARQNTSAAMPARDSGIGAPGQHSAARLVLMGIAVSGFCALGYEVLWTRILTLTIGTSVYGFTIMLAAFLTGIALGSKTYGLCLKLRSLHEAAVSNQVRSFGLVQLIIGLSALAVTFYIRDLPVHAIALHDFFLSRGLGAFSARQWANLTLAFAYMVGPAFCMGLAFPIAGNVNAAYAQRVGRAVGRVLASNTLGAILGSAVSGYLLIYVFGIERSLQLLTVVNLGLGALLLVSPRQNRGINWSVAVLTLGILAVLMLMPDLFRMWDAKYFAIFQNNQPEAYNTPQRKQDALDNTDVLFYHEGINSTISVIKIKGGNQAVLVNGKVVASSALKDRQCQLTLGHLPMLAHDNPRKVLVVGLGTGMTLGAVSVHPSVEALTLVEIEPDVLGAARTFERYNNHVLDHPKLKIVFNDGRNFLMTARERYDVITADPIHPWTQGSGYLYTAEYFQLASQHLSAGGVMCQWLPIYELSVPDLKSVVKTFSQSFKYTMTWLTQYDAELIGSNRPLVFDESRLAQRLSNPAVAKDLNAVMMGTATDFLSFFIMATQGMTAFSRDGIVNTDDNLYLEFSTPASVGKNVMQTNVQALARYRESILPYLSPAAVPAMREQQQKRWEKAHEAALAADQAHALFLGGNSRSPQFQHLLVRLKRDYQWFAPARFLMGEHREVVSMIPRLIRQTDLLLQNSTGQVVRWNISAVMARSGPQRAAAVFVDNAAKEIYGQRYFSGPELEQTITRFTANVMQAIQRAYDGEVAAARRQGQKYPGFLTMKIKTKKIITDMMRR